ncbi:hypothetical protein [Lacinutrix jangbogonensis]|uniref:hypothetical protein n=1 Tax=Lacinutrix jangbogonensis TaxID=1469557 RepID=UPI00053E7C1B|nr:hypothetical protein [Lacinutrix jangbogonensis]
MKKSILVFLFFCIYTITVSAQEKHQIDLSKSTLTWNGSKLFGFGSHEGTINFKEGKIIKNNNKIIGGEFTIDMNSIKSNEKETRVKNLIDQ